MDFAEPLLQMEGPLLAIMVSIYIVSVITGKRNASVDIERVLRSINEKAQKVPQTKFKNTLQANYTVKDILLDHCNTGSKVGLL